MQKIRMGMVGGGPGAFIGGIHRAAAQLDGKIALVCGAFCRNKSDSLAFGQSLGLDEQRCYADYQQMFAREAAMDSDKRMAFVVIATPNHLHYPVAKMALEFGFHVLSDKPATLTLEQTIELAQLVDKTGLLYGLTHTYTGYPMVKEAKHRIEQGQLGKIRKIVVEYTQGWLASADNDDSKQAKWRLDPEQAGVSCCIADIGVHAANLAEYVSGLQITDICAELSSQVGQRVLDDDGIVMLKFEQGVRGLLTASQVATGEENRLNLRIYGESASLEWSQLEPNSLTMKFANQSTQIIRAGVGQLSPSTQAALRLPAGHPEGYIEAFANLYCAFAEQIQALKTGNYNVDENWDVPGIDAALRGMMFIEQVVKAAQSDIKWHSLDTAGSSMTGQASAQVVRHG